ncbi:MAG: DNA polymerase III subunit gamma/tau [Actinobacteria bacterium]|nr:DNA polymerase III subunit gamma/tau [Actinomycetota bacterium]
MAYVSLYRKYRPQSFGDIVGQTHVTQTVINAIAEDRLHHAYLFTGPRGTGKTSTARILAKSINCVEGPTATPCNECDLCVSITNGSSVDVIELDMASHGGVDDARELRDRALFAPAQARRKVYILDEVHMASTAAFNALLKLIEEPPAHVLFAMATTDPQKVIPTIMSRVQRLDLRRIGAEDLVRHVEHICELEGYTIDAEAAAAVVRAGDGSARDTLSVLEQVLSFSGTEVTADKVTQVLGQTPVERTFQTVDLVAARDLAGLLALVQGLLDDGHDLRRFTFDLLQHLRDLLVLQVAPDRPDLVDATQDRRDRLTAQRDALPRESMLRAVDLLAETLVEMRQGPARLPIELALAKLSTPSLSTDLSGLTDRLARLEAATPAPTTPPPVTATTRPAVTPPTPTPVAEAPEIQEPTPSRTEPTAEPAQADPGSGEANASGSTAPQGPATKESRADAGSDGAADHVPRHEGPGHGEVTLSEPDPDAPTRGEGADDLARIKDRWEPILEQVKDVSRRFHAVYEPGEPVDLRRGILTLRYAPRYASFHAQNAKKGDHVAALTAAIERSCGLKVTVDTVVDGDAPRRPTPPVVTDASPVADEPVEPSPEEAADVREAELGGSPAPSSGDDVDALLASELGAELVEERAPAEG